jgi:membrane protein DedA with SNARE-associated domain
MNIDDIILQLLEDHYGELPAYSGVFVASFLLSLIIFVPVPYFPVLLASMVDERLNHHVVAFSSAVGVLAAKMIIFSAAYYGHKRFLNIRLETKFTPLTRRLGGKLGGGLAFAAALIPIPDDLVYIPLAFARYSPWKFAVAVFSGRFLMNEIIIWSTIFFGRQVVEEYRIDFSDPWFIFIVALAGALTIGGIYFLIVRIDYLKMRKLMMLIRKRLPGWRQ